MGPVQFMGCRSAHPMASRQVLNRTGRDLGASDCDNHWHPT